MIQILVGMIASGKSTYARMRAVEGAVVMNDDAVVDLVHAGDHTLYQKALKPLYKSIETHVVTAAILMGKDVIIDRGTNISAKGRKRWIGIATAFDVPCQAVVFKREPPEVHAARRFQAGDRGKTLEWWLKAAQRHDRDWEYPALAEGLSKVVEARMSR